jgi:hypothetical protein
MFRDFRVGIATARGISCDAVRIASDSIALQ